MFSLETKEGRFNAIKRMGNTYQVAGTRHYALTDGNCKNTEVIDVKTGSGLEYWLGVLNALKTGACRTS